MQPVLCVVGTDQAATEALVKALTRAENDAESWRIVTKYYEAEVVVRQRILDQDTPQAPPSCEALVVVTRSGAEEELLRSWVEKEREGEGDWPITLWVMDSPAGEKDSHSDCLEWCVENGFEYIHVSTSDSQWDEQLADEEGQGLHRLQQALEAHVWPGSTFLKAPSPNLPSTDPGPDDSDEDDFEKLLLEMTNARERLRTLSDEERREGAADLAMKLAQFFVDD